MYNYTKLNNGIRIASDYMRDVETVSVNIFVDVGARYERPEENGISHLLEHMAFKGTKRRNAREIAEEFDAIGGQANAYTTREHTVYYAKVLKGDVEKALDILCDILQNSRIAEDELKKEIDVVLQEIASSYDSPDDIIFDCHQAVAFPDQALGRPVLGTDETVKKFTPEGILSYIENHYMNDRILVVAAGNIQHENFVQLVEGHFSAAKNPKKILREKAAYKGGVFFERRRLKQTHLILGFAGLAQSDAKFHTLQVLSSVLGAGMSSRLFQEVREKRGLAYAIQPYVSAYADSGLFSVYAGTSAEKAEELALVICDELKKMTGKIMPEELARGKAQIKAALLMDQESTTARAEELGKKILCYGRPIPPAETIERIEAITAAEINRLMQEIITGSKPSFTIIGPARQMPEYEGVLRRLA